MSLEITDLHLIKQIQHNTKLKSILKNNLIFNKIVENITSYFSNEFGEIIDYEPVKTKKQFLDNYNIHDIALNFITNQIEDKGFIVCGLGKDLRKLSVEMKNEIPDLLILDEKFLLSLDIKAKRSKKWFGKINKRAVNGYRKFRDSVSLIDYKIPIYAQFILIEENEPTDFLGYSNLSEVHIEENIEWDKNTTYQFNWKSGLVKIDGF